MRFATLCCLLVSIAAATTPPPPINPSKYFTIYQDRNNATSGSGPCRGGGGTADKVNSRSRDDFTQTQCETFCDNAGALCTGYAYGGSSCLIYGPTMAGICSDPTKPTPDQCGTCSVAGLTTEATCGQCSIAMNGLYAQTADLCATESGTWTAGAWTPGTWAIPSGEWETDPQVTTHVNFVSTGML